MLTTVVSLQAFVAICRFVALDIWGGIIIGCRARPRARAVASGDGLSSDDIEYGAGRCTRGQDNEKR